MGDRDTFSAQTYGVGLGLPEGEQAEQGVAGRGMQTGTDVPKPTGGTAKDRPAGSSTRFSVFPLPHAWHLNHFHWAHTLVDPGQLKLSQIFTAHAKGKVQSLMGHAPGLNLFGTKVHVRASHPTTSWYRTLCKLNLHRVSIRQRESIRQGSASEKGILVPQYNRKISSSNQISFNPYRPMVRTCNGTPQGVLSGRSRIFCYHLRYGSKEKVLPSPLTFPFPPDPIGICTRMSSPATIQMTGTRTCFALLCLTLYPSTKVGATVDHTY
ncbi:uncharacterized protein BDZ83DRAFT_648139 [Colletotrichum acutatum]|uniref:Uncharacterized protein n=1 Tax=Glomerella acutata TaxID=27357 RepID=A0AAD8XKP7_GLOAC|nr:uncharacterized protein BDZ83DRAFT_648139 [Colletotrichum acutatum]KAK1729150.1 hypothetical protein BDZ83DRAFT_648139 [Colletotrichum acutatum]